MDIRIRLVISKIIIFLPFNVLKASNMSGYNLTIFLTRMTSQNMISAEKFSFGKKGWHFPLCAMEVKMHELDFVRLVTFITI